MPQLCFMEKDKALAFLWSHDSCSSLPPLSSQQVILLGFTWSRPISILLIFALGWLFRVYITNHIPIDPWDQAVVFLLCFCSHSSFSGCVLYWMFILFTFRYGMCNDLYDIHETHWIVFFLIGMTLKSTNTTLNLCSMPIPFKVSLANNDF